MKYLPDVLALAGLACVTYGISLVNTASAFCFFGGMLIFVASRLPR